MMKKNLIAVTMLVVFLFAGIVFALDDNTQTDTTQLSELMQWVLNLPPQLKGNTLKIIANDLAEKSYINEAFACYMNGIKRSLVEINIYFQGKKDWPSSPYGKQARIDSTYSNFLHSTVYSCAPPEMKKYICELVIANVVSEDIKKEAKRYLDMIKKY